jgi:hypothetical protein
MRSSLRKTIKAPLPTVAGVVQAVNGFRQSFAAAGEIDLILGSRNRATTLFRK